MSAICVFTPMVVQAAWPTISALAGSALAAAGYARMNAGQKTLDQGKEVELALEQAGEFGETLGEEESVSFQREDLTLSFRKSGDGRIKICVRGPNKTDEELKAVGAEAVRCFLQAYSRERVASELKSRGFTLEEEKLADGTIRIKARRYP